MDVSKVDSTAEEDDYDTYVPTEAPPAPPAPPSGAAQGPQISADDVKRGAYEVPVDNDDDAEDMTEMNASIGTPEEDGNSISDPDCSRDPAGDAECDSVQCAFPVVRDCGHDGCVRALGFTRGGALLTAGFDSKFAVSPHPKRFLKSTTVNSDSDTDLCFNSAHGDSRIFTLGVNDTGDRVVTGCAFGTLKIWDIDPTPDPKQVPKLRKTIAGHGSLGVRTVKIGDGWIASAGGGGDIRVWSRQDGQPLQTIQAHSSSDINALAVSADCKLMASGSSDSTIKLWNMPDGTLKDTFTGHNGVVVSVIFAPHLEGGPQEILSAGCDFTVRVWNVDSKSAVQILKGHTGNVISVVVSPNGKTIASASMDKTVILWAKSTGEVKHILKGHSKFVYTVTFSQDGNSVLSSGEDGDIHQWSVDSGEIITSIKKAHKGTTVRALCFNKFGDLVTAGFDNMMRCWRTSSSGFTSTNEVRAVFKDPHVFTLDVKTQADEELALTGAADGTIRLFSFGSTSEAKYPLESVFAITGGHGPGNSVRTVAIGQGNSAGLFASAGVGGAIHIWSLDSGTAKMQISGHQKSDINSLCFSPDGSLLSSASSDGTIKVWSMPGGTLKRTLRGHSAVVVSAVIVNGSSGDDFELISASCDTTVRIWNLRSGNEVRILEGHSSNVIGISVSPNGEVIASASMDKTVILWSRNTGKALAELCGHDRYVYAAQFYLDGQMLVSAGEDGLRFWGGNQFKRALQGDINIVAPKIGEMKIVAPTVGTASDQPELQMKQKRTSFSPTPKIPQLSNKDQLKVMELVKKGMSMDDALVKAAEMQSVQPATQSVDTSMSAKKRGGSLKTKRRWWGGGTQTAIESQPDVCEDDALPDLPQIASNYLIPNPAFDGSMGFDI